MSNLSDTSSKIPSMYFDRTDCLTKHVRDKRQQNKKMIKLGNLITFENWKTNSKKKFVTVPRAHNKYNDQVCNSHLTVQQEKI